MQQETNTKKTQHNHMFGVIFLITQLPSCLEASKPAMPAASSKKMPVAMAAQVPEVKGGPKHTSLIDRSKGSSRMGGGKTYRMK